MTLISQKVWDEEVFQKSLSDMAESWSRPGTEAWYGPQWPAPGVCILLTHQEPANLNGAWVWDGERWARVTKTEYALVLPQQPSGKVAR